MAFTPTTWAEDDSTPITAAQLNRMEQGIYELYSKPFAVGDYPIASSPAEHAPPEGSSVVYAKVKEIYLVRGGNVRVSFDMAAAGTGTSYGRLYVNGIAVGTERSTGSASYVTYTEDLTGLSAGDLIQLYTHTSKNGAIAKCRSLIVKASAALGWPVATL